MAGSELDGGAAARLIAETRGNPLALIELPGELTEDQLTGSVLLPEPLPVGSMLRRRFLRQVQALPANTQALLLLHPIRPATRCCCCVRHRPVP